MHMPCPPLMLSLTTPRPYTHTQVLEAFTTSFDFQGLAFDTAIRMFLESFLLPGEAQKVCVCACVCAWNWERLLGSC